MAVVESYQVKEWLGKRKLKFYYSSVCMYTMIGQFSRPWFTVPPTKTQIKVSLYWNLPLYVNPENKKYLTNYVLSVCAGLSHFSTQIYKKNICSVIYSTDLNLG